MKKRVIVPLLGIMMLSSITQSLLAGGADEKKKETSITERLERSDQFIDGRYEKMVKNREVIPNWINGSDVFWYSADTADGKLFFKVDIESKEKGLFFDHEKMAAALNGLNIPCTSDNLPITGIQFLSETIWLVSAGYDQIQMDISTYKCEKAGSFNPSDYEGKSFSPTRKHCAYIKDFNLYVMDLLTFKETQLTFDGEARFSYGTPAGDAIEVNTNVRKNKGSYPVVLWSPDGKTLATHRIDERNVSEMPLVKSAVPNGEIPVIYTTRVPFAGQKGPIAEFKLYNMESMSEIETDLPAMDVWGPPSPILPDYSLMTAWPQVWFNGNSDMYFAYISKGSKTISLYRLNLETGTSRLVYEDRSETFVSAGPGMDIIMEITSDNRELLVCSSKDGWSQLYLYDIETGKLKNRVTSGEYVVTDINRIDEQNRNIFFTACGKEEGRNPYYNHLYSINFDGSELKLLTPEEGEHSIDYIDMMSFPDVFVSKYSPSGKYFIDTFSKADTPPETVIRNIDGEKIMPLEKADITELLAAGWHAPEIVSVKADDNTTDIYGVIYKPSDFDPMKKYPVIDSIYGGLQVIRNSRGFFNDLFRYCDPYALAELGFIVVTVDGRGTPFRSKEFQDFTFNNFSDAVHDHVAAIKNMAKDRPYMDIDNVGITGISNGGYTTCLAMFKHNDFFKVGVSGNAYLCGVNYYNQMWTESIMDYPLNTELCEEMSLLNMSRNLKGKLMIMVGDQDEDVNPASQFILISSLQKEGKDFDMYIITNAGHAFVENRYSYCRKAYGYFLEHMKGEEIPEDFIYPASQKTDRE